MRYLLTLALAGLLAAPSGAQTLPTSPGRQRAANRQALRDASRTDSPYKDSHLAITRRQLRRGSTEGPLAAEPLRQGRDGRPRAGGRALLGRRAAKAQTEPTP